jgi:transcriptional regulator with XRE-family HTH domain
VNWNGQSLGNVIRRLRQSEKFSQEELAHRAGIHRTYVSQLERGLKSPTIAILFKLAHALGIKPSKIVQMLERDL